MNVPARHFWQPPLLAFSAPGSQWVVGNGVGSPEVVGYGEDVGTGVFVGAGEGSVLGKLVVGAGVGNGEVVGFCIGIGVGTCVGAGVVDGTGVGPGVATHAWRRAGYWPETACEK